MTRETKVGLLVGMGVILLIGIIVSDQLAMNQQRTADLDRLPEHLQHSIGNPGYGERPLPTPSQGGIFRNVPDASQPFAWQIEGSGTFGRPVPAEDPAPAPRYHDVTIYNPGNNVTLGQSRSPIEATRPEQVVDQPRDRHGYPLAGETRRSPAAHVQLTTHVVQRNESLIQIARKYYNNGEQWRLIQEHNRDLVGIDGTVREGAKLIIPSIAASSDFIPVGSERPVRVDGVPVTPSRVQTIKVEPNDTLSELAARHLGTATRWQELLDANRDQIRNAHELRAGMTLVLPAARPVQPTPTPQVLVNDLRTTTPSSAGGRTYTIRPNDNLTRIAERELGDPSRSQDIYLANRTTLKNPDTLEVGQTIRLP